MPPSEKKIIQCRLCGFNSEDKEGSYDHLKVHFKPEKLHVCKYDDCKFVTVHKHHFKYHQDSHAGYKPFQCSLCSYKCINQSMLTSHLKSHGITKETKLFQQNNSDDFVLDLRVDSKKGSFL